MARSSPKRCHRDRDESAVGQPLVTVVAAVVDQWRRAPAVLQALAWMIAAGILFAGLNAAQKFLTHELPPPEVVCLRYVVGSALLAPLVIRAGWSAYRPRRPLLMAGRSVVHAAGSLLWFTAIPHVGLAEISAIGFTGPIWMMLGASLFLGERMYGARWTATLVAFAGVLIVLWPGLIRADFDTWPSLMLLACSPLMAISFLISKALTRHERPESIVFWLGIGMGTILLPVAAVDWRWPTAWQWALLAGCGGVGSSAHYAMTRAFRIADVSALQSVRFLDLLWAAAMGMIVFGSLPTLWTLAGGIVICAATVWIARYEARRRPA